MSYILDALKRASQERERGRVPDLSAHALPGRPGARPAAAAAPRTLWIALGAACVALLLALGWILFGGPGDAGGPTRGVAGDAARVATAPTGVVPMTSTPAATPTPALGGASAAAPPAAPPIDAPVTASPGTTPPAAASPRATASPASAAATAVPGPAFANDRLPPDGATVPVAPPQAPQRTAPRPPEPATTTTAAAAPAPVRVYRVDELPPELRRRLPAFSFGGSMYSDNPADRLLILGGQLVKEGEAPAPGVVLREIRLRSAVFEADGYRYELPF